LYPNDSSLPYEGVHPHANESISNSPLGCSMLTYVDVVLFVPESSAVSRFLFASHGDDSQSSGYRVLLARRRVLLLSEKFSRVCRSFCSPRMFVVCFEVRAGQWRQFAENGATWGEAYWVTESGSGRGLVLLPHILLQCILYLYEVFFVVISTKSWTITASEKSWSLRKRQWHISAAQLSSYFWHHRLDIAVYAGSHALSGMCAAHVLTAYSMTDVKINFVCFCFFGSRLLGRSK